MGKRKLLTADRFPAAWFSQEPRPVTHTDQHVPQAAQPQARSSPPSFRELVREDLETQLGDWTRPGFHALLMYRIGNVRCRSRLTRALRNRLYRAAHVLVRNLYTIELHASAVLGRRVKIAHQGGIVIHEHAVIGADCVIRQGVTIGAGATATAEVGPVLGDDVELGAGAVVVGGIRIGDGVRIGPNAVVMTNVPAGSIVVANPPRIISGVRG